MIDLISIYALMLCKKVFEMRIGCDLLRMQYLGYLAKINLHFAFEAYRPKLGKSLKKKIKGAKSTAESFLAGGMYGKCLISPPFLRLEAILIFIYFLLNLNWMPFFQIVRKV